MESAWMRNGKLVLAGDMGSANISIDEFYHDAIRRALAISDLTPEQVEVAELEEQLRQARDEGVILSWGHDNDKRGANAYFVRGLDEYVWKCGYMERVVSARAAVAHVEALRKPPLPEPEEMELQQVCQEMIACGCLPDLYHKQQGPVATWHQPGFPVLIQRDDETPNDFHRRALREARKRDGDARKTV